MAQKYRDKRPYSAPAAFCIVGRGAPNAMRNEVRADGWSRCGQK